MANTPIVIDAKPLITEGSVSVWRMSNIPNGVVRGLYTADVNQALRNFTSGSSRCVSDHSGAAYEGLYAAVSHEHLISREMALAVGAMPADINYAIYKPSCPDSYSIAACTGEMTNRKNVSNIQRQQWQAELRELQASARKREQYQVLVDIQDLD